MSICAGCGASYQMQHQCQYSGANIQGPYNPYIPPIAPTPTYITDILERLDRIEKLLGEKK